MKFNKLHQRYLKESKLEAFSKFAGLDPFSKAIFKVGNQYNLVKDSKSITWHSPNTLTIHDLSGHLHNFIQDLREELKKEGDPAKFFYRTHVANSYGPRFDMEIVIGDDRTAKDVDTFPKYHYDDALYSLWYNAGLMDIPLKDKLASLKESKLQAFKNFHLKGQVEQIIRNNIDYPLIEWLSNTHLKVYNVPQDEVEEEVTIQEIHRELRKIGYDTKKFKIMDLESNDPIHEKLINGEIEHIIDGELSYEIYNDLYYYDMELEPLTVKESKLDALKKFRYDNFKHLVEEVIHGIVDPAYIEWLNDEHVRVYEFVEERQRDAKAAIIEALEKLGLKIKAVTIKHLQAIDPPTEEYSPNYTEWVADILFEKPLFSLKK